MVLRSWFRRFAKKKSTVHLKGRSTRVLRWNWGKSFVFFELERR